MDKINPNTDPQHYTWKVLFGKHTWWQTCDKDARIFCIIFRHEEMNGDITGIVILEKDSEEPKHIEYPVFFETFKKGLLQRTSKS